MNLKNIVQEQRDYFFSNKTLDYKFRKNALLNLRVNILKYEEELKEALSKDLGKNPTESYFSEIGQVLKELSFMVKNLKKFMKEKKVKSHIVDFPSKSFISPHPYGVVLIISPWNYPVTLTLGPLVGALASGNTVIIKPSEYSINTTKVIDRIINETFDKSYVRVVQGDATFTNDLLNEKYDYIFFTGSTSVGKIVMEKASKHLTPISLELGGKSPVIVDKDANVKIAAKRIAFGKYLNAGQTCIAPDYIYVHSSIADDLLLYLQESLIDFFGDNPLISPNYGKIINQRHFDRLQTLVAGENVLFGGETDIENHIIAPTILTDVSLNSLIMKEEIFGPILPIFTYDDINNVIGYINKNPKPLALYLFTNNRQIEEKVLTECNFGGGCINDTVVQFSSDYLPFGGVGESGMGAYHGMESFKTFTHYRSILKKSTVFDLPVRYAPYNKKKEKLSKIVIK